MANQTKYTPNNMSVVIPILRFEVGITRTLHIAHMQEPDWDATARHSPALTTATPLRATVSGTRQSGFVGYCWRFARRLTPT